MCNKNTIFLLQIQEDKSAGSAPSKPRRTLSGGRYGATTPAKSGELRHGGTTRLVFQRPSGIEAHILEPGDRKRFIWKKRFRMVNFKFRQGRKSGSGEINTRYAGGGCDGGTAFSSIF